MVPNRNNLADFIAAAAGGHELCNLRPQDLARIGAGQRDRIAMGLFKLLTFPVSMPLTGGRWVLQTLLSEAERRYYDEAAIRQEMAELERQLVAGEVDDETFDRREEELLERLLQAREYRRGQEEQQQQQQT